MATRGRYYVTLEARLKDQGANQGTIDAFSAEVRKLEAESLAKILESIAGDKTYTLGDIDPAIIQRIAAEIRHFRA